MTVYDEFRHAKVSDPLPTDITWRVADEARYLIRELIGHLAALGFRDDDLALLEYVVNNLGPDGDEAYPDHD